MTDENNNNSWDNNSKYLLETLKRIDGKISDLDDKMIDLITFKARVYGTAVGLSAVISILISIIALMIK